MLVHTYIKISQLQRQSIDGKFPHSYVQKFRSGRMNVWVRAYNAPASTSIEDAYAKNPLSTYNHHKNL